MIAAMLKVMALSLVRDRGALAMAFLLPPAIFIIFAAIFSGTSGDQMRISVSFGVPDFVAGGERLEAALRAEPSLRVLPGVRADEAEVTEDVANGIADVGLYMRDELDDLTAPPLAVLVDRGKLTAGNILAGRLQQVIGSSLPDVGLARSVPAIEALAGGLTPEQTARIGAGLERIAGETADPANGDQALIVVNTIGPEAPSGATVTYYAGAVAILFLLFSAMQSAATLIEERHSGILDRIAVGPAGTDVVVVGKFLFLTVQGVLQAGLIFLVAALLYSVDVLTGFWLWALTTLCAAAGAAGFGLAIAAACTTRQQAQTVSAFVVLLCSAIGGSMVPRFMMPPWLQDIGWFTPNAWAIEAYDGVLWRGESLADVLPGLGALAATAIGGTVLALVVSRLRLRL